MSIPYPASPVKVDEREVRLHALLIMCVAFCFVLTEHSVWLVVLIYDFSVRVYVSAKASALFWITRLLLKTVSAPAHYVDAEPKRFSAGIGLAVSLIAFWLPIGGQRLPSVFLMELLMVCAGVEALLRYCIGCEIHAFMQKHRIEIVPLKDDP